MFARDVTKSTIVCRSGHLNRHQRPSMSMLIQSHLQGFQSPKMVWPNHLTARWHDEALCAVPYAG